LGKHTGTPVRLWSYTVIENSQDTFARLLEISSILAESCFGKTDRPRLGSSQHLKCFMETFTSKSQPMNLKVPVVRLPSVARFEYYCG
ncbi:unnamed protein product, partial [Heterotrigona itama]